MLSVTAAAAVVSAVVSLVIPPVYYSSAALLPVGIEEELAGTSNFLRARLGSFGETYASYARIRRNFILDSIIRSRRMSTLMIERFELQETYGESEFDDARDELLENTVVSIKDTGVIFVGVEDMDPVRARDMTEAYVGFLDSLLIELSSGTARERVAFLETEVARREERLLEADTAMARFMAERGLYDLEKQAEATVEILAAMSARKAILEVEKEMLETTMREENPELALAELESEILAGQIRLLTEEGDKTGLFPPLNDLPEAQLEYVRHYSNKRLQEFALYFVNLRLEDAAVAAMRSEPALHIIDPPAVPERRVWPKRTQIVLISTAAGFLWVCFVLLLIEFGRRGGPRFDIGSA